MYNRFMRTMQVKPTARTMRRRFVAALAAALASAAITAAARADWIVTKQGERFETKGPWHEKGKLLVFNLPDGTLSSIRADRVDVAASQHATEQAKQQAAAPPPAAPEPVRRKAVIVLTDKDFQKSAPAAPAADAEAGGSGAAAASGDKSAATPATPANTAKAAPAAAPQPHDGPSPIEVVSWDRVPALQSKADGVEITGILRNASRDVMTEINLTASLYDDNGTIVAKVPATVETQVLPPTESSKFHLVAEGVYTFSTIKWETQVKSLKGRPADQPSTAGPPAPPSS
jgi:hypothetical protein